MLTVGQALLLVLFAAIGTFLVGGFLFAYGPAGIAASEVLFIGLPILLAAQRRGGLAGIGVVKPRARDVAGATLVGLSGWAFLAGVILPIQEWIAPTPPELERALENAAAPNLGALIAIAIVPALCEELLVRGGLAFALDRARGRWLAVLVSALVFGLLHASPYRFVPTFLLGCSFAAIALHAGSIVPTMIAHALNNGAIWLLGAVPALQGGLERNGTLVTLVAVGFLTIGHVLVFANTRVSTYCKP